MTSQYPDIGTAGPLPGFLASSVDTAPLEAQQAAAPSPNLGVTVSPDTLQRYADAVALISRLNAEQVRTQLPAVRAQFDSANQRAAAARQLLASLQQRVAKEAKDVGKVCLGGSVSIVLACGPCFACMRPSTTRRPCRAG